MDKAPSVAEGSQGTLHADTDGMCADNAAGALAISWVDHNTIITSHDANDCNLPGLVVDILLALAIC